MKKITVVLPTFNEAENIVEMIRNILALNIPGMNIIVADDDSRDGTQQQVLENFAGDDRVRLFNHPPPHGLSPSVVDAFDLSDSDLLCCMDADGQHRVEDLPGLLSEFTDPEINMIIGSRYIKNGGFSEKWRFDRLLTSRGATYLAHIFLRVPVQDPMSGFFVIRQTAYRKIRPYLIPAGFKIALELAWLITISGVGGVSEHPIIFAMRKYGESKLSPRIIMQYLKMLVSCSFKQRTIKRAMHQKTGQGSNS